MIVKRRQQGEGSVSRNARGLWVARISLPPTYDDDGKPKRRHIEKASTSQRVALDWLTATRADLARTGVAHDGRITVAEWSDRWLTIRAPHLKPRSMHIYRSVVTRWVVPTIGSVRLSRLRPADVRAVTDAMRAAGLAANTMHNAHGMLSAMLAAAVRDGLLAENPARRVTAPRGQGGSRGALTVEQIRTIAGIESRAGGCRYTVQLLTGLRQAEALGLTWDAVDLDGGTLTVLWQMQSIPRRHGCGAQVAGAWPCGRRLGAYCPKGHVLMPDGMPYVHLGTSQYLIPPKSGRARTVPLLPTVAEALTRHRDAIADRPNPHGLVFHRPDGVPLRPDDDQAGWRALLGQAGLPATITTHWGRHTLATLMMQAGVDAKVIGEIVGHSAERITRETYQHTSTAMARAGMQRLGELLG